MNVADFILDVSSGAVNSSKLPSEDAVKHLTACSERYGPRCLCHCRPLWAHMSPLVTRLHESFSSCEQIVGSCKFHALADLRGLEIILLFLLRSAGA